jgi:uncharacterized integral membrane protein
MFELVLVIVLSLPLALFSAQNTTPVDVNLFGYVFEDVPLFLVALVTLFSGVLLTFVMHLLQGWFTSMELEKKQQALAEEKKKNTDLLYRVHKLELKNTELKTKYGEEETDDKSIT